VHALLKHLETVGFAEAPRVQGFDERGREALTMIPGDVGNHPIVPAMATDASLTACATMLRRYHKAATIQPGWENLPWWYRDPDPARWEVICHGDVATYNIVYQDETPVGLIDFDVAGPGPRMWDVAYAAYRLVPLASDASCAAFGFATTPDRPGRLKLFRDAYGLDDATGLIETAVARITALKVDILARAAAGDPSVATHLREDHVGAYVSDLEWIEANEGVLKAVLAVI
jgi:aminoglycoside phosphotransferase (APT) family kinase protein